MLAIQHSLGTFMVDLFKSRRTPEMMLAKAGPGIRFNEHMDGDGPTVFAHACNPGTRRYRVEA
jgi:hypothetical protein